MKRIILKTLLCLVIASLLLVTAPIVPIVGCTEQYPQPDLTITHVRHIPGPMQNWHIAWVMVWNIGDWPADPGFTTRIILVEDEGRTLLTDFVHPGLPAKLFFLILYPFELSNEPPQQYHISAYTDYSDVVSEGNESNNGWVESDPFWA